MEKPSAGGVFRLLPWLGFISFLALFVGVFHGPLRHMVGLWGADDFNYCYLIPPAVAYLIWESRAIWQSVPAYPSWMGLLPVCLGFLFFWLGELSGEFYTLYLAAWLVAIGYAWVWIGGRRMKRLAFPVCFSLAMLPFPSFISTNLTLRLKLISSWLGVRALQIFGMSAYREGNVIDLGFTKLQVVDACSGLRFFLPIVVLSILLAYYYKAAWWKRAILVLMSVPISIVTNGFRIALTGILHQYVGAQAVEGFLHDFQGWLVFMLTLGVLVLVMLILKRGFPEGTEARAPEPVSGDAGRSSKGAPGPEAGIFPGAAALILLAATLILVQKVDFRENTPIARPLQNFPSRIGQWEGIRSAMEKVYLDALYFSDYAMIRFRNPQGREIHFYTAYYASQSKGKSIHTPDSCLPGGGWVFEDSGVSSFPVTEAPGDRMRVKRALMTKNGGKSLAYYWFPQRGRVLTDLFHLKLYVFWDALTRHRTDGALVRLITPVYESERPEDADARLQAFTREIVPILAQFIPR
jgi:exosortase D (VPLPA-CTERM-specific)